MFKTTEAAIHSCFLKKAKSKKIGKMHQSASMHLSASDMVGWWLTAKGSHP